MKIFLILGCNGISVLVVILHYNFATSSYWRKGVISFYYFLQLNANLQLFKILIDKNLNEFTIHFKILLCLVIFMTSWNSRFPWSCPKLPVQLYLPNKQNLHCSPYKTWTFPFYLCLWPEHLSWFILFRSSCFPTFSLSFYTHTWLGTIRHFNSTQKSLWKSKVKFSLEICYLKTCQDNFH